MAWDTGSWGFVCPECGAQLTKRTGKYGEFFGCVNYPRCMHSALVGADGKPVEKADAAVREARIGTPYVRQAVEADEQAQEAA